MIFSLSMDKLTISIGNAISRLSIPNTPEILYDEAWKLFLDKG